MDHSHGCKHMAMYHSVWVKNSLQFCKKIDFFYFATNAIREREKKKSVSISIRIKVICNRVWYQYLFLEMLNSTKIWNRTLKFGIVVEISEFNEILFFISLIFANSNPVWMVLYKMTMHMIWLKRNKIPTDFIWNWLIYNYVAESKYFHSS